MNHKDWDFVNRRLVAKMLSEMEYEQVFHAESQGDDHYCINLPGAQWRFIAERGIWGWLWIDAQTLRCTDEPVLAQTLLMQLKPVLSMSDATVAEHMQDLYATLLGDLQLLKARRGLSASDLINLDADRLQCLLSGHPKFVFNKGRRGWGKEALERYAPEYANTFRLHWLAVKREHMIWRCDNDLDIQQLLTAAMDPQEFTRFSQVWQENGLDHNWLPLPVHPWQWQQKIATDDVKDDDGSRAGTVRDDAGSLGGYLNLVHTSSGLWADIVAQGTRHSMKASSDNNDFRARGWGWLGSLETGLPFSITDNLMLEPQLQYTWQGLSLDDGQDNAGYVKFGHGSAQHVRAGFRLGSHNDMTFGEGTSSRDTLRDSAKHSVSELPVNWWVQPSVIRTFSSRGDMSMGTAAAGSNMTFSPSRNGTSLDLQAGLEARIRENITLGVQAGYAHSVSGSSAEGYNGQATLNMTF
ncbi:autotransporter domain-containing protein [Escherichia coli]|nr:autotransporter domain-containing protein [Escherichia coli]